jgi:hypothetical protein
MKQTTTRKIFSYWNTVRGERSAPERRDIDPAAIRSALSDTFMLEVDRERTYPLRLSGARVNALFLDEVKGRSFIGLWDESEREGIATILESVLDDSIPVVLGVSAAPVGRQPLELELLLLPLRHNGRTHARIMGALTPASIPSWFGLLPIEALFLKSLRIVRADMINCEDDDAREIGVIPTPAHVAVSQFSYRRGHLSVFSGGRDHRHGLSK